MSGFNFRPWLGLVVWLGMLLPGLVQADDVKEKYVIEYPNGWKHQSSASSLPYPNVWVRKSPAQNGAYSSTAILDENGGDPLLEFIFINGDQSTNLPEQYVVQFQEFFSGRGWDVVGEKAANGISFPNIPEVAQTPFSNGSRLGNWEQQKDLETSNLDISCYIGDQGLFLNKKNGDVIWHRFLVQINEKPTLHSVTNGNCYIPEIYGEGPNTFVDVNIHTLFWSVTYAPKFILKDDTFLMVGQISGPTLDREPFVIRFDQDLHSPFLKTLNNVYVIDIEELKPLLALAKQFIEKTNTNALEYFDTLLITYLKTRGHRP